MFTFMSGLKVTWMSQTEALEALDAYCILAGMLVRGARVSCKGMMGRKRCKDMQRQQGSGLQHVDMKPCTARAGLNV